MGRIVERMQWIFAPLANAEFTLPLFHSAHFYLSPLFQSAHFFTADLTVVLRVDLRVDLTVDPTVVI